MIEKLHKAYREISIIEGIQHLLDWDHQCFMPSKASSYRGQQVAALSRIIHQKLTAPSLRELAEKSWEDVQQKETHDQTRRSVFLIKEKIKKSSALPESLVGEIAEVTSTAMGIWEKGKLSKNKDEFLPILKKVIALRKAEASCIDPGRAPYDVMLDEFSKGFDQKKIEKIFDPLKKDLPAFIQSSRSSAEICQLFKGAHFDKQKQQLIGEKLAKELGFDFDDGVLSASAHPFSTTLGPCDFRITTHYDPSDFMASFHAIAHEVGHSLYERSLPKEFFGLPIGSASSMDLHESQSLFWEKRVACSKAFLQRWFVSFKEYFPDAFASISFENFYHWVNRIEPSLIRVAADEVTYLIHVMIRFDLEKKLISEDMDVMDLETVWNSAYKNMLGVHPSSCADGFMQDIHWAVGLFGYFPSYGLGHLIASELTASLEKDLGSLESLIEKRAYQPILHWMNSNIHQYGMRFDSAELLKKITGKELSSASFMSYLNSKYKS